MPIFRYKGYGPGGGPSTGTIEADGPRDAAIKLKSKGLHPWDITRQDEAASSSLKDRFTRRSELALAAITRQLAVLLGAGVPLVEALRALSGQRSGNETRILIDIRERITGGASFARALEAYPDVFPEYFRGMVEAGESSGALDSVLLRLADYLEAEQAVHARVRSALIYPLFMVSVCMIVLSFLFTFVVPKIVKLFENSKAALPVATRILISLSSAFMSYWWLLLLIAVALIMIYKPMVARNRERVGHWLMTLISELYISRLTRSLGFLLEGGLPVIRALELSGKATGNEWLRLRCHEASLAVQGGATLSGAFEGTLPPMVLTLMSTGERSGRLAEVLGHAARGYETEFDRRVQKGLTLLEPALILLMGGVVGFIVFAVLLPMFQLNQLIK